MRKQIKHQYDYKMEKDMRKLQPRKNNIGKFKVKEVYREGEKKEVIIMIICF